MDQELLDAAGRGDVEVVRRRLAAGADIDSRKFSGETALCLASQHGHLNVVNFLLARGAKISGQDIVDPIIFAISRGHFEIVSSLLRAGSNPNLCDKGGRSLISTAAARGDLEIVRELITYQADVNLANKFGSTPILEAVLNESDAGNYIDVIAVLIDSGAEINHRNSFDIITNGGSTALILAARMNKLDIVKLLVQAGADVEIQDERGLTALDHANEQGYTDICTLLRKN